MPAPTPQQLRAELDADPAGLGYAARVAARDDVAPAALLNATAGPGAATVALDSVPRNVFLNALRPGLLALADLPAAVQTKWDRILAAINTTAGEVTIDATTKFLLSRAVTDGVLTQAQADAAWHRVGSRAEGLWGPGVIITPNHIAAAFGRV